MLHDWVIVLHQLMLDAYFDWVKRVPSLKEMSPVLTVWSACLVFVCMHAYLRASHKKEICTHA
jgi:hypothetical protein